MKSQSALEFMTIVGIGLIIIAITSMFGMEYISNYFSDINVINAKQTTSNLISASNLVYSQGMGAQTQIYVTIPGEINYSRTYLYDGEVNIRFGADGTKDSYERIGINMTGTLPTREGRTSIFVRMLPGSKYVATNATDDVVIDFNMPNGAFFYLNDPNVSLILIQTYDIDTYLADDTTHNFEDLDIVYCGIGLLTLDDVGVDSELKIKVYKPDSTLYLEDTILTGDEYTGLAKYEFGLPSGDSGYWIISLLVPETKAIGTTMFYKS